MKAFRIVLVCIVVAAALFAVCPAPASAADYWGGYWNWYDGTYVPYYQRYYSYGPAYYGPAYSYYGTPSYNYYGPAYGYSYGYAPYGAYYGLPRAGVGVYPGGTAVRVGPLGIGWR
jgi:hypothetical protein